MLEKYEVLSTGTFVNGAVSHSVQVRGKDDFGAGKKTPMGEDCLTINILAPLTNANKPRKVVMWFYGGAFLIGSASLSLYCYDKIVTAGDVVFVSSNFRLGGLGWIDFSSWSTPEHPIERNLGLRDQVAALQWVSRNIAAFGGDPNDVTIANRLV
ncbi:hypothetical protein HK102_003422 [Quaeritorhiza haematococci]|nr:hypothetical protein HK102_003422 [Quaeritorhiza haematococci]